MTNVLALPIWRQLRAALPGHHANHDNVSEAPAGLYPEDRDAVERQRAALELHLLGWGSGIAAPARFYPWEGGHDPRVN